MLKTITLVAIGGAIGSVLRYLTSVVTQKYVSSVFPWATLITNIIGCFLIGLLMGWLSKNQMEDSNLKWLLVTGFCGGYTTFSAFGFENISLLQNHHSAMAFGYIALSIIAGLLAVWGGLFLVK
ncbi:fluoride efflux transporter CrcB [Flavobacterium sp.]|uniref:fluoride efflux transporter CrcB n=1 Tax=Flavobacterium sp. TaxID=239 RepID=UPI0039E4CB06